MFSLALVDGFVGDLLGFGGLRVGTYGVLAFVGDDVLPLVF